MKPKRQHFRRETTYEKVKKYPLPPIFMTQDVICGVLFYAEIFHAYRSFKQFSSFCLPRKVYFYDFNLFRNGHFSNNEKTKLFCKQVLILIYSVMYKARFSAFFASRE